MITHALTSDLSVSPQISVGDVARLKAAGYASIVCHRPDGEDASQPSFDEIANAARLAGLIAIHQPIMPGNASEDQAAAFAQWCTELPKPTLAYCRTGTRSATLWAISQIGKLPLAEILQRTTAAGFNVTNVLQRITGKDLTSAEGSGPA